MKKLFLISAVILLLISAGCAKKGNDPDASQGMTLEAVSEEKAEIMLTFEMETTAAESGAEEKASSDAERPSEPSRSDPDAAKEATQPTAKGETAAAKSGDAATQSNTPADKSAGTTAKSNGTTALSSGTPTKPNETTDKSVGTPVNPNETTAKQNESRETLPIVGDESDEKTTRSSSDGDILPIADGTKNRYELPAIPLK